MTSDVTRYRSDRLTVIEWEDLYEVGLATIVLHTKELPTQLPQSHTVRSSSGAASGAAIAQKYEKSVFVNTLFALSPKEHSLSRKH